MAPPPGPTAAAERPARLRGRCPPFELRQGGGRAGGHAGRGQPTRSRGWKAQLGTPLFRRYNRQVLLTDAGSGAWRRASATGWRQWPRRWNGSMPVCSCGPLTVTVPPSFAVKWLMPRAGAVPLRPIRRSMSGSAAGGGGKTPGGEKTEGGGGWSTWSARRVDLGGALWRRGPVSPDCAATGCWAKSMFPRSAVPACWKAPIPLRTPADLIHHTLLHEYVAPRRSGPFPDWRMWLRAVGVEGHRRGTVALPMSRRAWWCRLAIEGEGVALGRSVLVAEDIAAGRLVRPFETVMPTEFGYWVVTTEAAAQLPRAQAFRQWLKWTKWRPKSRQRPARRPPEE